MTLNVDLMISDVFWGNNFYALILRVRQEGGKF